MKTATVEPMSENIGIPGRLAWFTARTERKKVATHDCGALWSVLSPAGYAGSISAFTYRDREGNLLLLRTAAVHWVV